MSFFRNKVVWVTGASSGLGEALALELAKEKSRIVISARRQNELERVKMECTKYLSPENIYVLPMDVAAITDADAEVKKITDQFGRIDVLINNAGIAQRSLAYNTRQEVERKIMEVNFWGAVLLTKAVLNEMRRHKAGNVAVISSVMGKFGYPGTSMYSASKHALAGYFESLRFEEMQNNIRIHLIYPGYIRTQVSFNAINEKGEKHGRMDPGQNSGMSPGSAARKVLEAIRKNKCETFFGGKEMLAIPLRKYFPSLFYKVIAGQMKK
jgi:short-subunit dehydrogenase